uniref:VHS domain-containing protein n=1 Tax=Pavo cristatus TaxID=9049 RepID=A0A8C9G5B7_PAVCR
GPAMEAETLEARINKATNPLNKELDWDGINAFCEQLNKELEGPPLATRLLAHKIQSPQEWEAIQALTVRQDVMEGSEGDPPRARGALGKFSGRPWGELPQAKGSQRRSHHGGLVYLWSIYA